MIYLDKHEGWYSVSDECFFPESAVEYTLDRRTGRKMHVSCLPNERYQSTSGS